MYAIDGRGTYQLISQSENPKSQKSTFCWRSTCARWGRSRWPVFGVVVSKHCHSWNPRRLARSDSHRCWLRTRRGKSRTQTLTHLSVVLDGLAVVPRLERLVAQAVDVKKNMVVVWCETDDDDAIIILWPFPQPTETTQPPFIHRVHTPIEPHSKSLTSSSPRRLRSAWLLVWLLACSCLSKVGGGTCCVCGVVRSKKNGRQRG
jgi:hypothetical protein